MRELSWNEFSDAVGTTYTVRRGDAQVKLKLEQASELASSGRAAGSFRLEFRGPREPLLEQAIYQFEVEDDSFDIFIVPLGQDAAGTSYEAIFC